MVHIMKDAIPVHLASNLKTNKTEEASHDDKLFSSTYKQNASRKSDNRTVNSRTLSRKEKENLRNIGTN